MGPKDPYKVYRQEHLGDFLDVLESKELLTWSWGYENKRALFKITEPGQNLVVHEIMEAEGAALRIADREGIPWIPVPHPGGHDLYKETQPKMALFSEAAKQTDLYSNE